jgi:HD-like signal output (HDOD) protein
MKRVLFVDDEPKVLEGLRRMLYSLRREWHVEFAEGGPQALQRLAEVPFDVVVTDMRMPGMDGAELLHQVMARHPDTVRIVLSGQCDRETVLKTVDPTHQFLTKPCEPETLRSTLAQVCKRREQLCDNWHRQLVSRVTSVPSHPLRYRQLICELRSSGASLEQAGMLVAADVGMTAKILQLVSSSFFGTPQFVTDPTRAASLFDLDTLRALAFSTRAFSPFDACGVPLSFIEELNIHSAAVAAGARAIVLAEGGSAEEAGQAYLAGFLHDIGLLVLTQHAPERFIRLLETAVDEPLPLDVVERAATAETHAEIGAYLMALWGLPGAIVDVIAFHHRPAASPAREFKPLAAVHVATAVDSENFCETWGAPDQPDTTYLAEIGVGAARFEQWSQACKKARQEVLAARHEAGGGAPVDGAIAPAEDAAVVVPAGI